MPLSQASPTQLLPAIKQVAQHAWPLLVGQLAVMGYGLVDNVMAGRAGSDILASMAVGSSIYISLYVGLMGVIIGLTPICSAHFGAGDLKEVGEDTAQGFWVAMLLSALGVLVLLNPDFLFELTDTPETIAEGTRGYLDAIAVGLPAALLFRVFYAMNQAISRPRIVMVMQVVMLALKIPLNEWFLHGGLGVPALGAAGFGWATAVTMWVVLGLSILLWHFDPHYRSIRPRQWIAPNPTRLTQILKLGLPIGGSYLIEVTSFTFIALLVARFGEAQVGAHQIVANLAAIAYMVCLSLGNATCVLCAQHLGAKQWEQATAKVKAGLVLALLCATVVCSIFTLFAEPLIRFYTTDEAIVSVSLALMPWVTVYHLIDAFQTLCSFSLRGHQISARPMLIYGLSLWGLGIGGGMVLGVWLSPPMMSLGFWIAGTAGLALAAALLAMLLVHTIRNTRKDAQRVC